MSKTACVLLLTLLATFIAAMLLPPEASSVSTVLVTLSALSGAGLLVALVIGRRFKFDPLLR